MRRPSRRSARSGGGALSGAAALPPVFAAWFERRGWRLRAHQAAMIDEARAGRDALLTAPTGGGKTLGGFLPSLIDLADAPRPGLHTLYVSPLKALATDIARNLTTPIAEMRLAITVETRTGDTPQNRRRRQREKPPHLLLTTPESLALLTSFEDADAFFASLSCVIVDELHALAENKRGLLTSLALSRLRAIAPSMRVVGLSATAADPKELLRWITPRRDARVVVGEQGPPPEARLLLPDRNRLPWAGHMGLFAAKDILDEIARRRTVLVFVNTRAQAELIFAALWRENERNLPIALHHGSLAVEQRRKVEAAMAKGALRAVVCTSSLDLGVDWGEVDLVVQVGAPKGSSRLTQRIGRANHRLDQPSEALLAPANRFEVLECQAAIEALAAGELDRGGRPSGGLDVLAQHVLGRACAGPFLPSDLYEEVISAGPYRGLERDIFDQILRFVSTGGYALKAYERYRRLFPKSDGSLELRDQRIARRFRMNAGVIVEAPMMWVRLAKGRGAKLGQIEEDFISGLRPGDTFLFAGRLLAFVGVEGDMAIAEPAKRQGDPSVPVYAGARLPLTTEIADRVKRMLADERAWPRYPAPVQEWLALQKEKSEPPPADGLLVEIFPRKDRFYLVAYAFAGRNAQQSLGMLLTRRMQREGAEPMGFVASDYALAIWSRRPPKDVEDLFDVDMLGDDLEEWMAESSMLRRCFRNVAVIAGLIERKHPGQEKTGRQVTFNSDLIYDVLRKHEPDHILLRAAREDAASGLTDLKRLAEFLTSVQGKIKTRRLKRISPFAVPLIAEIGREWVMGEDLDDALARAVADLVAEADAD